jgi:small subunit ribosomal protein S16
MVKIRLARHGSKKNPYYHVVVADARMPRDGRKIEDLGRFNPMARGKEERLRLSQERIEHWIKQGAKPTVRVAKLIKEHKAAAGKPAEIRPTRNEIKREQAANAAAALAKKKKEEAKKAAEEAKAAEAAAAEEAKAAADSSEGDAAAEGDAEK